MLPQVQGLATACCDEGICPQLEMQRVSNGAGRSAAADVGKGRTRERAAGLPVWDKLGGKRAGNQSFKDDRKPGNVEQGWEVQRKGEDRLPSTFHNSKQDAAGQEAALS